MKLKEFLAEFEGIDPEIEVGIVTKVAEEDLQEIETEDLDGLIWNTGVEDVVDDERPVSMIQYGKLLIQAYYHPEE